MEKNKKRSIDEEIQNSSSESLNKKIKAIDINEILEKFGCNSFFIDKSLFIKEFIDYTPKRVCVTRPSKYGKTANLIMMREFFQMNVDNKVNSENRKIFEQLNISKEIDRYGQNYIDSYLGKYPVIFINFDGLTIGNSYDETINNFKDFIQSIYGTYESIVYEKLNKQQKKVKIKYMLLILNFMTNFILFMRVFL